MISQTKMRGFGGGGGGVQRRGAESAEELNTKPSTAAAHVSTRTVMFTPDIETASRPWESNVARVCNDVIEYKAAPRGGAGYAARCTKPPQTHEPSFRDGGSAFFR